jgi:hypothetical protein
LTGFEERGLPREEGADLNLKGILSLPPSSSNCSQKNVFNEKKEGRKIAIENGR